MELSLSWINFIDSTSNIDFCSNIVYDTNYNFYVVGYIDNSSKLYVGNQEVNINNGGKRILYIIKFSRSGEVIWTYNFANAYNNSGFCLEIDTISNILYVGGNFITLIDTSTNPFNILKFSNITSNFPTLVWQASRNTCEVKSIKLSSDRNTLYCLGNYPTQNQSFSNIVHETTVSSLTVNGYGSVIFSLNNLNNANASMPSFYVLGTDSLSSLYVIATNFHIVSNNLFIGGHSNAAFNGVSKTLNFGYGIFLRRTALNNSNLKFFWLDGSGDDYCNDLLGDSSNLFIVGHMGGGATNTSTRNISLKVGNSSTTVSKTFSRQTGYIIKISQSTFTNVSLQADFFIDWVKWVEVINPTSTVINTCEKIRNDNLGNLFITGYTNDSGIKYDNINYLKPSGAGNNGIFLLKVDSSGNFIEIKWIDNVGSEINSSVLPTGQEVMVIGNTTSPYLTIDNQNYYKQYNTSTIQTAFLKKLNSSGIIQDLEFINSLATTNINGMDTDNSGNIYCIGTFGGTTGTIVNINGINYDKSSANISIGVVILKFNSNLDLLWIKIIDGTANDTGQSIAVEKSTEICYVTGWLGSNTAIFDGVSYTSGGTVNSVAFIAKFDTTKKTIADSSGTSLQWVSFVNSSTTTDRGIDIDTSQNSDFIVVTGYVNGRTIVYSYNDANQNVINQTLIKPNITNDNNGIFLLKINKNDSILIWEKWYDTAGSDISTSISLVNDTELYLTGYFNGTLKLDNINDITSQNSAGFVVKFSNIDYPTYSWHKLFDRTFNDQATYTCVDSLGNVYFTGNSVSGSVGSFTIDGLTINYLNSSTNIKTFIAKYNSSGVIQWARPIDCTTNLYSNYLNCDSNNNIYLSGYFESSGTITIGSNSHTAVETAGILIKYNSLGTVEWYKFLDTIGTNDRYTSVMTNGNNVFVSGHITSNALTMDGNTYERREIPVGQGSFVARFITNSVPDSPIITNMIAGNNSVLIYFNTPNENGSAITEYRIISNPGNILVIGNSSPILFTGLTVGISYTFLLTAINSIGESSPTISNSILAVSVPDSPIITDIIAGNNSVLIYFNISNDNGSAITGYKVVSNPITTLVTGNSSPILFTGLTNGISYTFSLVAENTIGESNSTVSNSIIPISNNLETILNNLTIENQIQSKQTKSDRKNLLRTQLKPLVSSRFQQVSFTKLQEYYNSSIYNSGNIEAKIFKIVLIDDNDNYNGNEEKLIDLSSEWTNNNILYLPIGLGLSIKFTVGTTFNGQLKTYLINNVTEVNGEVSSFQISSNDISLTSPTIITSVNITYGDILFSIFGSVGFEPIPAPAPAPAPSPGIGGVGSDPYIRTLYGHTFELPAEEKWWNLFTDKTTGFIIMAHTKNYKEGNFFDIIKVIWNDNRINIDYRNKQIIPIKRNNNINIGKTVLPIKYNRKGNIIKEDNIFECIQIFHPIYQEVVFLINWRNDYFHPMFKVFPTNGTGLIMRKS